MGHYTVECMEAQLKFNVNKTMHGSRRKKWQLKMEDQWVWEMEEVKVFKYLEMWFDRVCKECAARVAEDAEEWAAKMDE